MQIFCSTGIYGFAMTKGCQLKGLSLLPLFLSLRATIRAKVAILQPGGGHGACQAKRTITLKLRATFLAPHRLDFVAIGGLSGTGKSSLRRCSRP